jgi:hypothetical protein
VYYCHNCQSGGRHSTDKYESYRDDRHGPKKPTVHIEETVTEPEGLVKILDLWPTSAQVWAIKNRVTPAMVALSDIAYDPQENRVYIPRYDVVNWPSGRMGELVGYQLRLIEGRGPKYTTVQLKDSELNYTRLVCSHRGPSAVKQWVIVEDYVSACHIAEATYRRFGGDNEWGVAVNYGTKINTHLLYTLREGDTVTVWLDNDSEHVRNQARIMAETVQLYGVRGRWIDLFEDPKHHGPKKIREVLTNGLN